MEFCLDKLSLEGFFLFSSSSFFSSSAFLRAFFFASFSSSRSSSSLLYLTSFAFFFFYFALFVFCILVHILFICAFPPLATIMCCPCHHMVSLLVFGGAQRNSKLNCAATPVTTFCVPLFPRPCPPLFAKKHCRWHWKRGIFFQVIFCCCIFSDCCSSFHNRASLLDLGLKWGEDERRSSTAVSVVAAVHATIGGHLSWVQSILRDLIGLLSSSLPGVSLLAVKTLRICSERGLLVLLEIPFQFPPTSPRACFINVSSPSLTCS